MLGAIYIGLSGMDAYAKGLQTISNNVANLNSPGYKSTSVSFSDIFSRGGGGLTFSDGTDNFQSGNGVRFSDPLVDFQQGDMRQTNRNLDLALQGNGFLVLQSSGQTYYARTGSFAVDQDGFVSLQGSGYHLSVLDGSNRPVALNVDQQRTSQPAATTTIKFSDNLSSTGTTASVTNINVYDSQGGSQVWTVAFAAVGASSPGEWNVTVTDQAGATVGTSTLKFNGSAVDPTTQTLTINSTPAGADPLSVVLDFSAGVTSFSSGTISSIRAASVDGNAVGSLTGVSVDTTGQVKLTYSNGKTILAGAVAIADFRDPQELVRVGDGLFQDHAGGQLRLLPSGKEGIGTLVSGQIEASNVNLSQEFGDLILIQRGFQASSQVVSVSNDMIQELFGIRGHG